VRQSRREHWPRQLFRSRHRLVRGRERLGEAECAKLCELFGLDPVIGQAWALREAFRAVYRAGDRAEAERRLTAFFGEVSRSGMPAFHRLRHTRRAVARGAAGLLRRAHQHRDPEDPPFSPPEPHRLGAAHNRVRANPAPAGALRRQA
jgi:hypothetical protein